jgi:hypothetical protein
MNRLYTKILTQTEEANQLANSFRNLIKKWLEENNTELYNPIELAHLLNEELDIILCGNFSDIAEELQTNSEVVKDHLIDELSDAVKKVIDDNDSKSGDYWPDVINKCRSAYLKKIKHDMGDN